MLINWEDTQLQIHDRIMILDSRIIKAVQYKHGVLVQTKDLIYIDIVPFTILRNIEALFVGRCIYYQSGGVYVLKSCYDRPKLLLNTNCTLIGVNKDVIVLQKSLEVYFVKGEETHLLDLSNGFRFARMLRSDIAKMQLLDPGSVVTDIKSFSNSKMTILHSGCEVLIISEMGIKYLELLVPIYQVADLRFDNSKCVIVNEHILDMELKKVIFNSEIFEMHKGMNQIEIRKRISTHKTESTFKVNSEKIKKSTKKIEIIGGIDDYLKVYSACIDNKDEQNRLIINKHFEYKDLFRKYQITSTASKQINVAVDTYNLVFYPMVRSNLMDTDVDFKRSKYIEMFNSIACYVKGLKISKMTNFNLACINTLLEAVNVDMLIFEEYGESKLIDSLLSNQGTALISKDFEETDIPKTKTIKEMSTEMKLGTLFGLGLLNLLKDRKMTHNEHSRIDFITMISYSLSNESKNDSSIFENLGIENLKLAAVISIGFSFKGSYNKYATELIRKECRFRDEYFCLSAAYSIYLINSKASNSKRRRMQEFIYLDNKLAELMCNGLLLFSESDMFMKRGLIRTKEDRLEEIFYSCFF